MCDTLTSLHPAAPPVFCTLATPRSVQSFHRSLERLRRRRTSRRKRRQRTRRDSGTESESSFYVFQSFHLNSPSSVDLFYYYSLLVGLKRQNPPIKRLKVQTVRLIEGWGGRCGGDMFPGSKLCLSATSTGDFGTKRDCRSTTFSVHIPWKWLTKLKISKEKERLEG